jgi:small subunit ribosomal protein S8
MTDPIADYLTRIRNAVQAHHAYADIPASRVKAEISKILLDAGYIKGVKYIDDNKQGRLRIYIKYGKDEVAAITGLKRVSKPGLRAYLPKNRIPRVRGGYGIAILSTSQGILPDAECRSRGIGGEVICEVW